MMKFKFIDALRSVLFPFSWLYGLISFIRNKFYDWDILKSQSFAIPVICVGNITVGGTGKTPHVEYLIRTYAQNYKMAVLSRGYGRKTKGFRYVETLDSAEIVGDEPLQMKQKFPDITFAVDEKRVHGIELLQKQGYNLILLDDAFQHRAVLPTKSVVLLDYHRLPEKDTYLPSGNLREGRRALKRGDIVLVTKCPTSLLKEEKSQIIKRNKIVSPYFFTHFEYGVIQNYDGSDALIKWNNLQVLLVTGIANPTPLVAYLQKQGAKVQHMLYADHYDFGERDLNEILQEFGEIDVKNKIIVTTEKDKVKLLPLLSDESVTNFHYIPIKIAFENREEEIEFHKYLALKPFIDTAPNVV